MPILFPEEPAFVNTYERTVWEALRDQLGDGDALIANRIFNDNQRDYEVDLIVAFAGSGVVVLEIKGGKVGWDNGHWWQGGVKGSHMIDPVGQVVGNKHVAQQWVHESAAWGSRQPVRWTHAVVFPSITMPLEFESPELHRTHIIDETDLLDIASKLRNLPLTLESNRRLLDDYSDVPAIVESLSARLAPRKSDFTAPEIQAEAMSELVERLSHEQAMILNVLELVPRVHITGGAGTGKTWLAVEQARRLTRQGLRVALVSYSRGLAEWMKRRVATFTYKERPDFVGTFHQLGEQWGAPVLDDNSGEQYWLHELPQAIAAAALAQPESARYDALIIDEAQDFAPEWWATALAVLAHEDSHLYVFSDSGQRIFDRESETPDGLVPIHLKQNIRNTRQISQTFNNLGDSKLLSASFDGQDVRFVECEPADAVETADGLIDGLLEEGWRPGDIALLTTGRRHPVHDDAIAGQTQEEHDLYWDSFWSNDDIFFGHVAGFKGLERPVVVLAINEQMGRDQALERLYVGLSRARDLLIVVGSSQHIEDVAGSAALKKIRGF